MTIDEAIKHAEEVAEKNERRAESVRNRPISSADFYNEEESCSKCAEEHRQLAVWLKELKAYRDQGGDAISRQKALDTTLCDGIYCDECSFHTCEDGQDRCLLLERIKKLPSVTPKWKSEDVAKAFQLGMALGFGEKYDEMDKVMEEVKKAVTPHSKMGKWINDKCSVCGKGIEDLIASPEWYRNEEPNFCPFCGIKIEEVEE
jgi:hypothetical protein